MKMKVLIGMLAAFTLAASRSGGSGAARKVDNVEVLDLDGNRPSCRIGARRT